MTPNIFYPDTASVLYGNLSTVNVSGISGTMLYSTALGNVTFAAGTGYRGSLLLVPQSTGSATSIKIWWKEDNTLSTTISLAIGSAPYYFPMVIFYAITNVTSCTYQFIGEKFTWT